MPLQPFSSGRNKISGLDSLIWQVVLAKKKTTWKGWKEIIFIFPM